LSAVVSTFTKALVHPSHAHQNPLSVATHFSGFIHNLDSVNLIRSCLGLPSFFFFFFFRVCFYWWFCPLNSIRFALFLTKESGAPPIFSPLFVVFLSVCYRRCFVSKPVILFRRSLLSRLLGGTTPPERLTYFLSPLQLFPNRCLIRMQNPAIYPAFQEKPQLSLSSSPPGILFPRLRFYVRGLVFLKPPFRISTWFLLFIKTAHGRSLLDNAVLSDESGFPSSSPACLNPSSVGLLLRHIPKK